MTQQCALKFKISSWHTLKYTEIGPQPHNRGCIKEVGLGGRGPQSGGHARHPCSASKLPRDGGNVAEPSLLPAEPRLVWCSHAAHPAHHSSLRRPAGWQRGHSDLWQAHVEWGTLPPMHVWSPQENLFLFGHPSKTPVRQLHSSDLPPITRSAQCSHFSSWGVGCGCRRGCQPQGALSFVLSHLVQI